MNRSTKKLLLVMEQCNPRWPSVPQVAFQIYNQLNRLADVTLVTHERNREGLTKTHPHADIVYLAESRLVRDYYGVVARATSRGNVNWPLQHALSFPVYAEFDRGVKRIFGPRIERGEYAAILGMTPVLPRYPYSLAGFSKKVPFILGPVNGGLPFPEAFGGIAVSESSRFNFLRQFCRLLPHYVATYEKADRIIAGSAFTRDWIADTFAVKPDRLHLLAENGVVDDYFSAPIRLRDPEKPLALLFAGRLVPYKGADMLLDALKLASPRLSLLPHLTLVGDGPERGKLEQQAAALGLSAQITFTGLVPPDTMPQRFREADLFCFPSIREFGGAVVLEAMASGVPCIVADHGGIGEYVNEACGVKIAPSSREHLVTRMADAICEFDQDKARYDTCSANSRERAEAYRWSNKAERLLEIVAEAVAGKQGKSGEVALAG
jgi:glycosyltransferase involved in cell wall biosynthesis